MTPVRLPKHHPAPGFALTGPDGASIALRDYTFRKDLLLVCLHGPRCPFCAQIAAEMGAHRDDWESWGTEALLVSSEPGPGFDVPLRQACDPAGEVRRRYSGGTESDVALAVIEHRGRLMDGWSLRHPEPVDWHEIAETVRWVAVQEPECGACEVLPGYE